MVSLGDVFNILADHKIHHENIANINHYSTQD